MKFQACTYKKNKNSVWRLGFARVLEFDDSNVEYIIDAENGDRPKKVWDYHLHDGRNKHLEMPGLPNKVCKL